MRTVKEYNLHNVAVKFAKKNISLGDRYNYWLSSLWHVKPVTGVYTSLDHCVKIVKISV